MCCCMPTKNLVVHKKKEKKYETDIDIRFRFYWSGCRHPQRWKNILVLEWGLGIQVGREKMEAEFGEGECIIFPCTLNNRENGEGQCQCKWQQWQWQVYGRRVFHVMVWEGSKNDYGGVVNFRWSEKENVAWLEKVRVEGLDYECLKEMKLLKACLCDICNTKKGKEIWNRCRHLFHNFLTRMSTFAI